MSKLVTAPGSIVAPDELRAIAADGTKLRYALMDLASKISDAIVLGRGDPDLDTPAHVISAVRLAILDGRADVAAPISGLSALREAVANKLRTQNLIPVEPDDVLITDGGQEALYLLMQTLLNPEDEILVPDPRYSSYDEAIHHAGARMVLVPTYPEDNFDLRSAEIEKRITPKTKAILVISPSNPTAAVVGPASVRAVAEIACRHNLVVISDEIYEKLIYSPSVQTSIASLPGMYERTITLGGFSKTYAMTGWRVGYVAAPADFIEMLAAVKASTTGAISTVSQYAALAALTGSQDIVAEYHEIYSRRRSLILGGLGEMGFTYGNPQGAFFVYTNAVSSGIPAFELSYLLLKEAHVLIFPGTAFGEKWVDWLRIAYLQPEDQLALALDRMKGVLGRHR